MPRHHIYPSLLAVSLLATLAQMTVAHAQAPMLPLGPPMPGAAPAPGSPEKSTVQLSAVFTG